jgi:hypothetical protein
MLEMRSAHTRLLEEMHLERLDGLLMAAMPRCS